MLQGIEPRKGIATTLRAIASRLYHLCFKGLSPVRGLRPVDKAPGDDHVKAQLQGIEPRKGIATGDVVPGASRGRTCCKGLSPVRGLRRCEGVDR